MLIARQCIIFTAFVFMMIGCRFAVRYAVCRRQFKTIPGSKEERKLLDYQTHMAILAPVVSSTFVIQMSGLLVFDLTLKAQRVYQEKKNLRLLQICHHLTAAVKG